MSDRLNVNEALALGEERSSGNGQARLVFQGDGNLVLYVARPVGQVARWASNTFGQPAVTCVMQGDGNLVIYDGNGQPLWASGTHGNHGASLVVQDDENAVIYGTGGNALWSTDTWIGGWVDTGFAIASSGLRFTNNFPDANIAGIRLTGLCGGMSFTALDYHYAGRPSSRLKNPPSTESNSLGGYIKARHVQSLINQNAAIGTIILAFLGIPLDLLAGVAAGGVPNYNLQQFLQMQGASDSALRNRSFDGEFQRLRAAIDAGKPVPLGLISRGGGLTDAHQLIAIGYRDGKHDRWIRVFDQNRPSAFRELWVSQDHDITQTSGETWRGCFVEEYNPEAPPLLGIDENLATDSRAFEAGFYLRLHDDLVAAFGNNAGAARSHWLTFGTRELRRGSMFFDPGYYLAHYADLKAAFGSDNSESAIEHWIANGIGEGRRSSAEFDINWYLTNHPDLTAAFGAGNFAAALQHWFNNGLGEGRRASADFDVGFYLGSNGDLQAAFGPANFAAAFEHWLKFGKNEGRKPIP